LGETFILSDYVGASLIIGACASAVLLGNEATDEGSGIDEEIEGVLPLSGE
jgi:hypothetical protein